MSGLSYEVIDAKPMYFNFSEGFCSKWEISVPLNQYDWESERYFPIYNYAYPLGERFSVPDDFRVKLNNTTIVNVEDDHYLALTGCGMDYTWEIVESYMNLGYYPPVHFSRLPAMAGRGESQRDKWIIDGCQNSLDAMIRRLTFDKEANFELFK